MSIAFFSAASSVSVPPTKYHIYTLAHLLSGSVGTLCIWSFIAVCDGRQHDRYIPRRNVVSHENVERYCGVAGGQVVGCLLRDKSDPFGQCPVGEVLQPTQGTGALLGIA